MNSGKYVFAQILQFVNQYEFASLRLFFMKKDRHRGALGGI